MTTPQTLRMVIGCYTQVLPHVEGRGTGISFVDLDIATGAFSHVATHTGIDNSSYLSHDSALGLLYVVSELSLADGACLVTYRINRDAATLEELSRVSAMGDCPCHIDLDHGRRRLFLSNYVSGSLVIWPLDDCGLPHGDPQVIQHSGSGANPDRQESPHVHSALAMPDGKSVMVCDAGTDEIVRYALAGPSGVEPTPRKTLRAPGGSLPRHMDLSLDGRRLFVVHELGNIISAYHISDGGFSLAGRTSTLPADVTSPSAAAAIRVHPNGRFLYASNRGHDSITLFDISDAQMPAQFVSTFPAEGQTPREFAIDPTGRFMVIANQDSHALVCMQIDQATGHLHKIGDGHKTGSPVCIAFV